MKRYLPFVLLVITFLGVTGCQMNDKSKNEKLNVLSIHLSKHVNSIHVSEIASSVKCIPLETQDELLIDNILRVITKDGIIYVADKLSLYRIRSA